MVEVIDFKDLSTHLVEKHDPSVQMGLSVEDKVKEKKSMNRLFIAGGLLIVIIFIAYNFFYHDRPASGTEASAFEAGAAPVLSSIHQEYKNLKDITCDEGKRQDCISYTLTFYPQNLDQGGVVEGVTAADVNRLGEFFNVILQSKLKHLESRKENLTFTIISTNVSPTDGESKVTYVCAEDHEQIQCK